ncbi:MAG TPA: DPP IV N-terminal domain-containing protein [Pyrinomonadaceae bacterium]|nr:DPP IV N-terminal domain-containing protein [Pyrinomonadaceae bacterium]
MKGRTALILMIVVSMSGVSLSLNSSARAGRSKRLGTIAADENAPPTQPGTNGKIAFTSMRDGNAEIYVMNADGSNQVNLTKNPAKDQNPSWSPDGSRIAFVSERDGDIPGNVYVMNADGSNVTRITQYPQAEVVIGLPKVINPVWSPDGKKLLFVMSNPGITSSLLLVNADGSGDIKTLTSCKDGGVAEWSPDGTRIAFTAADFKFYSQQEQLLNFLFVMNADGSGKTRVGDFSSNYVDPKAWPPVFSGPTWSPDGATIAYSFDNSTYANQTQKQVADIAVVDSAGGGYRFLTNTPSVEAQPSWSPDGSRIAFTSNRDGRNEIYVMNADGSLQVRLTNSSGGNFDPHWQSINNAGPIPPTDSVIQFSSPRSLLIEPYYTGGTYSDQPPLTVTRLGDLSRAATVDYATSDTAGLTPCDKTNTGVASSRCDYVATSGTLHFAPGEASKAISVLIIDDTYTEGDENFFVTLSNPTGARLGVNRTATATIPANDIPVPGAPVPPNPISGNAFFVRQHYFDFLNREPEPNGYNGWMSILTNCPAGSMQCDRIEVSADFFRSPEFQDRGYFVFRFYSAALGRNPNYSEFMPDLRRVSGFQTDAELEASKVAFVNDFVAREEFRQKYDAINDPAAYVDAILQTAGVKLSQRQTLIDDLRAGRKSRAEVLRAIAEAAEVYNRYYNTAFVVMQYFGYLRRDPDILYLNWIDTLDKTGDYRTMINGFMNSAEYRQRFGP